MKQRCALTVISEIHSCRSFGFQLQYTELGKHATSHCHLCDPLHNKKTLHQSGAPSERPCFAFLSLQVRKTSPFSQQEWCSTPFGPCLLGCKCKGTENCEIKSKPRRGEIWDMQDDQAPLRWLKHNSECHCTPQILPLLNAFHRKLRWRCGKKKHQVRQQIRDSNLL